MNAESLTSILTYLGILGIPSIFAMTAWCIRKCNQYTRQLIILMQAQKAQMRAQLLKDFHEYKQRGYVIDIELQEWSNQYKAYHELVGENGILDDRYQQMLKLPNAAPVPVIQEIQNGSCRKALWKKNK